MLAALHVVTTCLCVGGTDERLVVRLGSLERDHKNVRDRYRFHREFSGDGEIISHEIDTRSGFRDFREYSVTTEGEYKVLRKLNAQDGENFFLYTRNGVIHRDDGPAFSSYHHDSYHVKNNVHVPTEPILRASHELPHMNLIQYSENIII